MIVNSVGFYFYYFSLFSGAYQNQFAVHYFFFKQWLISLESESRFISLRWIFSENKPVSGSWISNFIAQYSVGYNFSSMSLDTCFRCWCPQRWAYNHDVSKAYRPHFSFSTSCIRIGNLTYNLQKSNHCTNNWLSQTHINPLSRYHRFSSTYDDDREPIHSAFTDMDYQDTRPSLT